MNRKERKKGRKKNENKKPKTVEYNCEVPRTQLFDQVTGELQVTSHASEYRGTDSKIT